MEPITEPTSDEAVLRNRKSHKKGKTASLGKESETLCDAEEEKSLENGKRLERSGDDEPANIKAPIVGGKAKEVEEESRFVIRVQLDGASVLLFLASFVTRFYRLTHPNGVV